MLEDNELIAGCLSGESKHQELLYQKYARKMLAVCFRYTKNEVEAEDVFQDAFVKIFHSLPKFRSESSLETWMRKIMVNTALNHIRTAKWKQEFEEIDEHLEISDNGDEEITTAIDAKVLIKILNTLPDGYRSVFNLYVFEHYTHAQIAEELGISEGTSKSQLSRARNLLRQLMIEHI